MRLRAFSKQRAQGSDRSVLQRTPGRRVLRLAYPVILIVLLGLLLLGWSLHDARQHQKQLVAGMSEQSLARVIQEKQQSLNLVLGDYAHWEQTLQFSRQPDPVWARREIGENLIQPFDLAFSLILNRQSEIIWWQPGDRALSDPVRRQLQQVLQSAAVIPVLQQEPLKKRADVHSAFFRFQGTVYSLHTAWVTSDLDDYQPSADQRAALVLLKALDRPVLDDLTQHWQVSDMRLSDTSEALEADRAGLMLRDLQGQPVARLSWRPVFSADSVYAAVGPHIVALLILSALCFFWYVSRVRADAALLEEEIQARIEAQQALQQHQEQLEALVDDRTQALYEALEQVREASEEKTRFNRQMSHGMRTPLNAISGFAQLLQAEVEDPDQLDAVEEILKACRRLTDMVDQAQQLARMQSGDQPASAAFCRPLALLDDTLRCWRDRVTDPVIESDLPSEEIEPVVPIAKDPLRYALDVLLKNAVQYTPAGGVIRVEARLLPDRLQISVQDSGVGIPEAKERLLFQPFSRLHFEQMPSVEGVGLGLFMARKKLTVVGGDIRYHAPASGGSCFTVLLPLAAPDKA